MPATRNDSPAKGNLWIRETFINETRNCHFGDSPPYESFTPDLGVLFRDLQGEYGRCVSRQYIDKKDGSSVQTGWVFEKRMTYEDARRPYRQDDFYTRHVWVTVYASEPIKTVTWEYSHPWETA